MAQKKPAVPPPKRGQKVKTKSKISRKMREKLVQDGGLGPKERKRLRTMIRQAWHWTSDARRIVIKRCLFGKDGFSRCEACKKLCPKILVDHIERCGDIDDGFIRRVFVSSDKLQGLCKKCHDLKTWEEKSCERLGLPCAF